MPQPRQLSFLPSLRIDHGGDLRRKLRKQARPFSHRHAIHVVLRSHRARGHWSMLTKSNEARVENLLERAQTQHHIRVYLFVNVGNHLHLLIKAERRDYVQAKRDFQAFLKQLAGEIAFQITGAKKGEAKGGFWEKLAYSRLITWGREFIKLKEYFTKNFYQAINLSRGALEDWLKPTALSLAAAGVGPPHSVG